VLVSLMHQQSEEALGKPKRLVEDELSARRG